jgi:fucose 4-O-acetylase-like acetyltransferase
MTRTRLAFIDWMKCLGILLIVYGHVAGGSINHLAPPIYPKQLGVAFFLFVLGYSLARDTRPVAAVLFNRLFEIYLYGLAFALLLSVTRLFRDGGLDASNYLPFALGYNVFLNRFPANPTTWFIGTYFHALLLWALVLRRIYLRGWMIVLVALGEIVVRAVLLETAGQYVAYMALSNWTSVLLLGLWHGQRQEKPRPATWPPLAALAVALVLLVVVWPMILNAAIGEASFPFMKVHGFGRAMIALATSTAVTFVYLAYTRLVYRLASRLPSLGVVRLSARNTLLVFVAHMPLFYAVDGLIKSWSSSYAVWVAGRLLLCFVLLTLLSELLSRLLGLKQLRDCLWSLIQNWWTRRPPEAAATDLRASVLAVQALRDQQQSLSQSRDRKGARRVAASRSRP